MRGLYVAGAVIWVCAVAAGLSQLWAYENAPGAAASAPARWPANSSLPAPSHRPALAVLLHPQCPCSKATVAELARLRARVGDRVDIRVFMLAPFDVDAEWVRSSLWAAAEDIPGVTIIRDDDGAEARRFGALTSGQVMLYDTRGQLRFSGGITSSRGHEGDNTGRDALTALILGDGSATDSTLVFGCSLFASTSASETP
jgi:hypothetical protein